MPSTWVTPRVWTAGERVSASKMNEISTDFNSLFPYTTGGDLAYRDGAGAYMTRLAIGSIGTVLTSTGSIPSWVDGTRYMTAYLNADVALSTGDYQGWFWIPPALNGFDIVYVGASRKAGGTGVPAFQLRNVTDSVDVLTTKVTIDSGEVWSGTAATPPVIDTTKDDVASGDQFAVDVDVSGTNTFNATFFVGFRKP